MHLANAARNRYNTRMMKKTWFERRTQRKRLLDARLQGLLFELMAGSRLGESSQYVQHGTTSCLLHSLAVAYYSALAFRMLRISFFERDLLRGALLHDYFLYDWHTPDDTRPLHAFAHPRIALYNAQRDLTLTPLEKEIVLRHMFPVTLVPPRHREAWMVSLVDKLCSTYEAFHPSAYPGLRRLIPSACV